MTNLQAQSRWYVYELVDPRDQAVFYVGKGAGKRVDAHEAEAASKPQVCSRKLNRIRDIWESGEVTTAFYNAGLPGLFREINANPSWRDKFVSAMKFHKVDLQYGCP